MHYAIRYTSEYRYDGPVTDNLNALRVKPATTSSQRCDEFHTRIDPEARVSRHLDYFGTEVLEFGIPTSHRELAIDVRTRVVTSEPARPAAGPWESLRTTAYEDAAGEFALPWQDQPALADPQLRKLHEQIHAEDPLSYLRALCELIPDRFEYRPGATYVGSTVSDLLEVGAGVCQDFVHLALSILRHHGIAARYVSGYLFATHSKPSVESVEVDTHAWLEALLPVGAGDAREPVWVGADPTNRRLAGETHVKIGHGRFYADVPPVKGLYLGGATSELTAAVTMTRLDPQAGAKA